jgi:hypothetical protein
MTRSQLPAGTGIFLFVTMSTLILGPSQPPIQQVLGLFGDKMDGYEANNLPLSTPEVKNVWSYTSTPLYVFKMWSLSKGIYIHDIVIN